MASESSIPSAILMSLGLAGCGGCEAVNTLMACLEPAPLSEDPHLGPCLSPMPVDPTAPPPTVPPPVEPEPEPPLHPCLSERPPDPPMHVCLSPPLPPAPPPSETQGLLRPAEPTPSPERALASALGRLPADLAARIRGARGA